MPWPAVLVFAHDSLCLPLRNMYKMLTWLTELLFARISVWLPLGSMIMFEHLGDDLEDVDRKEKDKKAAKEKEVEMKPSGLNENVDMAILPGEDQGQTDSTNILIEGEDSNSASPPTTVHDGDASE